MNIYRSSRELQGKILEFGDTVIFSISNNGFNKCFYYNVLGNYLNARDIDNDIIFKQLGILDKNQYVSKLYGYECGKGNWPQFDFRDFKAITRVVIDLFRRCEEHNFNTKASLHKDNEFTFTIKDIPKSCPYHPYVIDQALVEFANGIRPDVPSVKAAFDYCTSNPISCWFKFVETTQGHGYWEHISHDNQFTPSGYVPTYFREISDKSSSEFSAEPSEKTSVELPENTYKMSVEIPTSYEETVLSIEEKTVHF